MTELELRKVEETNEAFDRAHRIVPPNIVLNPSRKQTGLFSALAGLERMIRHEPNRTSTPENSRYSCPVSSGNQLIIRFPMPLKSSRIPLRQKTNFTSHFNHNAHFKPFHENKSFLKIRKSDLSSAHSGPDEGAYASSRTLDRQCDGRCRVRCVSK